MNSIYERYEPAINCPEGEIKTSMVFVADSDKLLVKSEGEEIFPSLNDLDIDLSNNKEIEYLGTVDNRHCFCLHHDKSIALSEGMVFTSLRSLLESMDETIGSVAARAVHIAGWSKRNRFCGVCGGTTQIDGLERARRCTCCGNIVYPRISPAIIIAIVKGDKILLAHNKNFRNGWYSTIAGFVEPGETIEDCARREVFEEVGIHIKNIRYFSSQPWPFPDSLMIGLTAEYESGTVKPDGVEIEDAGFYRVNELPDTPGKVSIAGRLIGWFVENNQ